MLSTRAGELKGASLSLASKISVMCCNWEPWACSSLEGRGRRCSSRAAQSLWQQHSSEAPFILCECHVLDTGARCCPCFSTLIPEPVHSLAVNLCTSKFQGQSKAGCRLLSLAIHAVQKGQHKAAVKPRSLWQSRAGGLCLQIYSPAGSGEVEKHE